MSGDDCEGEPVVLHWRTTAGDWVTQYYLRHGEDVWKEQRWEAFSQAWLTLCVIAGGLYCAVRADEIFAACVFVVCGAFLWSNFYGYRRRAHAGVVEAGERTKPEDVEVEVNGDGLRIRLELSEHSVRWEGVKYYRQKDGALLLDFADAGDLFVPEKRVEDEGAFAALVAELERRGIERKTCA